jgi:hypothetical protein
MHDGNNNCRGSVACSSVRLFLFEMFEGFKIKGGQEKRKKYWRGDTNEYVYRYNKIYTPGSDRSALETATGVCG